MKNYTVTTNDDLRCLCIKKNWFTCGSNEQYAKLFHANESGCSIEEIATIIWLCSDEEQHCRRDILATLIEVHEEFLMYEDVLRGFEEVICDECGEVVVKCSYLTDEEIQLLLKNHKNYYLRQIERKDD